ncbi:MAG: regulatory protein GemA [Rhodocyclaceae bacterium]|nr:regulatory protein GemA [Rhodocyclaceae bacterium]
MSKQRSPRARVIAAIKTGERQLGMDHDAHVAMVRHLTGRDSLTLCTPDELRQVLDHVNAKTGYKRREPNGRERRLADSPEARMVRGLWVLLHRLGAVRNPSEAALAAYVKRMAKVDDLHWAGGRMEPLIESLKAWAARELPAALERRLAELQAVGAVDRRNTSAGLIHHVAPTRNPGTFDALNAAWESLDELEAGRVAGAR